MQGQTSIVFIYTTFPDLSSAKKCSHLLVKKKLIACSNLVPNIISIYSWNDATTEDQECIAIFKTTLNCLEDLKLNFKSVHPYENPALICFESHLGLKRYFEWVKTSTKSKKQKKKRKLKAKSMSSRT